MSWYDTILFTFPNTNISITYGMITLVIVSIIIGLIIYSLIKLIIWLSEKIM